METQKKLERENLAGNSLQNRTWSQNDSEEEEEEEEVVTSVMLNETNEPRFVCERAYRYYFAIKDYALIDYHEYY